VHRALRGPSTAKTAPSAHPLPTAVAFKLLAKLRGRLLSMESTTPARNDHQDEVERVPSGSIATLRTLTRFKAWANGLLYDGLRSLNGLEHIPEFDMVRLALDHTLVVDLIFQAHLSGVTHDFNATRSPQLRPVGDLERCAREVDRWYVEHVDGASEASLLRRKEVRFTDGKVVAMSPAEMILHVVNHGTFHRGNVGVILQKHGFALWRDGVPDFLAQG
jgi:uncharacterized damage-inducible protein DinB